MRLRFDEFVLDGAERTLRRGASAVPLEPKVFDCLALLASQAGKLVTVERLHAALWPNVHVGGGALRRVINEVRKALGDSGRAQAAIVTRKRLGYLFAWPVERDVVGVEATAPAHEAWPFVGRARELSSLRAAAGLCFVSGEAGAGKSTLLGQLAAIGGGRWLWGPCDPTAGAPALQPFRAIALQLTKDPELRRRAQVLLDAAPLVRPLFEPLPAGELEPLAAANARRVLQRCVAVAAFFAKLALTTRLHLVIEDVHWADDGSIGLLEALARLPRSPELQLYVSYRREAVTPDSALAGLIARHSGRAGAFSLDLSPLLPAELRLLLASVQLPASAAESLAAQSGGNALYVHELVRHALTTGQPLGAALPPSLEHIVAARVSVLPSASQVLLRRAAVLGEDFSLRVLAGAAGRGLAEISAELEPALRAGLLRESTREPGRMRFSHALVSAALVARLSSFERAQHHAMVLRAVATLGSRAEQAFHAFEAGELVARDERRLLCEAAGREAFAALAFDRAALQLRRALQLVAADEHAGSSAELALLVARARWHADHLETEVEAAFLEAAERARQADEAALFAESAIGYAVGDESSTNLRIAALRPEAIALIEEAWCRFAQRADMPRLLQYRVAAARAWLRVEAGLPEAFEHAARDALALAPEGLSPARRLWREVLRAVTDRACARERLDAVMSQVRSADVELRVRIEVSTVVMSSLLSLGELSGWERVGREVTAWAAQLPAAPRTGRLGERHSIYMCLGLCMPVMRAVIDGRFGDAELSLLQLTQAMQQHEYSRSREGDHNGFHIMWQLYGYQGRSALLEPVIDELLIRDPRERWFATLARLCFALERGDRVHASAQLAELRATGFAPQIGGRALPAKPETWLRLADACVEVGTPSDAEQLYAALLPRAAWVLQDGLLICWGACARPLGALAHQLRRFEVAEDHYRAALALNDRIGHRPELARTQLGLARVLQDTGRGQAALALAQQVAASAETLGMAPLLAQARRLAAEVAAL
ncbi:MAG: AAA family ATPase [Polyangiales bacterium]